jgi:hypothetical protein
MSKQQLILIGLLAAAAAAQLSFAPHFSFLEGKWPAWINLIDATVLIIALFEKRSHRLAWAAAILGGAAIDLYSDGFFGLWVAGLLAAVLFIKFIIKKYVRIPSYW